MTSWNVISFSDLNYLPLSCVAFDLLCTRYGSVQFFIWNERAMRRITRDEWKKSVTTSAQVDVTRYNNYLSTKFCKFNFTLSLAWTECSFSLFPSVCVFLKRSFSFSTCWQSFDMMGKTFIQLLCGSVVRSFSYTLMLFSLSPPVRALFSSLSVRILLFSASFFRTRRLCLSHLNVELMSSQVVCVKSFRIKWNYGHHVNARINFVSPKITTINILCKPFFPFAQQFSQLFGFSSSPIFKPEYTSTRCYLLSDANNYFNLIHSNIMRGLRKSCYVSHQKNAFQVWKRNKFDSMPLICS